MVIIKTMIESSERESIQDVISPIQMKLRELKKNRATSHNNRFQHAVNISETEDRILVIPSVAKHGKAE